MASASSKRSSAAASDASHSRRSGASGNRASAWAQRGAQAVLVARIVERLETIEDVVERVSRHTSRSRVPGDGDGVVARRRGRVPARRRARDRGP